MSDMTKEKSIDILKSIKAGFEKDEWMADDVDALAFAIRTLEIFDDFEYYFAKELKDIKAEILKEMERLKGNSGCDYFTNCTIDNCIGTTTRILDKHIKDKENNL